MAIEFRCHHCAKLLRTPDESAGKKSKCPECGTIQAVPEQGLESPSSAKPFPSAPSMSQNPYDAPQWEPQKPAGARATQLEKTPALWNPNAAVNWSVLFSPVFGAYLHLKNWQALGESAEAARTRIWLILSVLVLSRHILLPVAAVLGMQVDGIISFSRVFATLFLFAWYFCSAKKQAKYIKLRYAKHYPRRGWAGPLLVVFGIRFLLKLFAAWWVI